MDDSDSETPRTLLSAVLKRNEPQQTIRQLVRRSPCRPVSSDPDFSPIRPHTNIISSTPVDKKVSASVSDATPRGLLNEILSKHNITKTLRVTVRRIHPDILSKKYIQEAADVIQRQEGHDGSQITSDAPREEQNDTPKASGNESLMGITSSLPLTENEHQQEIPERTPATSTNIQDLPQNQYFKQRVKRMRLSDIMFSPEKSELDSFTNDLIDKVKALIRDKEKHFVSERKMSGSPLSPTRIYNQSASYRRVSLVDAASNTEAQEDIGKCNSIEIQVCQDPLISPSDVDVSSDLGPLELSRITEEDSERFDGENNSYFLSTARSTDQRVTDTEIELVQTQAAAINNTSQEVLVQRHYSQNQDSDIWSDFEPMHEDPNAECQERPDDEVLQLPQTIPAKEKLDSIQKEAALIQEKLDSTPKVAAPIQEKVDNTPKEAVPVPRSSSTKKYRVRRRRQKPPPNNLPFTSRQLLGIVKHYSNHRYIKPVLTAFEEASRQYFTETAKHLERICRETERSVITSDIVEYLMKRRRTVTRKKNLHVLIEENLPMEYREELIPMAISGNVVLPERVTGR